ncbi:MAG: hypothetical protein KAW12_26725 [Candidatus Aminicenantes bacterium]|nr:hypothetical protein [Candidatus Aminicenantes bacterium]
MEHEILDSKKIIETINVLNLRIAERFPGSGLSKVGGKLYKIGRETDAVIAWIEKANIWYRLGTAVFIALLLAGLIFALFSLKADLTKFTLMDAASLGEAVINEIVLLGAAVIFLVSIETRAKRKKVITAINRLRSIAHVIDAHQLTKDPYSIARPAEDTEHSPKRTMTEYELGRYLDYCSELLSLTGKVGFLYVQKFDDPVSVNAVNELEELTTGLSRKVWQKLMILETPAQKNINNRKRKN